jgi:hypothetical protein
MFKAIKDNKITAINETGDFPCLDHDSVEEDTEHTVSDYEQYQGEYLLKEDIPAPTQEEQKEKRAQAYLLEVDPITAHIQRERDEAEPDEQRIAELLEERAEKVAEIKERYPYPESKEPSEDLEEIIASGD